MTRQDPTRVPLFLLHNNVHKMIVSSLHRRIQRVLLRCELRLFSPRRGGLHVAMVREWWRGVEGEIIHDSEGSLVFSPAGRFKTGSCPL